MDFDDVFGGEADDANGDAQEGFDNDMFMFSGMNQDEVDQYKE